jgi:hypothetical protein
MAVSNHTIERVQEIEIGAHQGVLQPRPRHHPSVGVRRREGEQHDDRHFYTSSSGTRRTNGARNPHFLRVVPNQLVLWDIISVEIG